MCGDSRLPPAFLRGLEADLRALCADARRRNPDVKEAAERVILVLKEAGDGKSERDAADEAASTLCAACETIEPNAGSSALSLQVKIALRAVSCLHKLLTHHAVSSARLSEMLDALERLSFPPVDDNLTVKVLQALLSLLTVRSYAKSLSEDGLSRAFSLLFILRTSRSSIGGSATSNALSAISQISVGNDGGVIEQTSKAAFRQASSYLFASAADSAVKTAVERQAAAGSIIPLSEYRSEASAAHNLFVDLCSALTNDKLVWLDSDRSQMSAKTNLDLALALEVIDDGLANNIALFAGHPLFCNLLSSRLCPAVHKLLRTTNDKLALKSLLGLVVTLTRNYWRRLAPDSEALLYTLTKMSTATNTEEATTAAWGPTYAIEALRCVFRGSRSAPSPVIDFAEAFDFGAGSVKLVSGIVSSVCDVLRLANKTDAKSLPSAAINGTMKPFANTISNSNEYRVAIAIGLYIEFAQIASESIDEKPDIVREVLVTSPTAERAISVIGNLIITSHEPGEHNRTRLTSEASISALQVMAKGLGHIAVVSIRCGLENLQEKTMWELSRTCQTAVQAREEYHDESLWFSQRIIILFEVLFHVQRKCQEALGRSWLPIVEALEKLDELILQANRAGEGDSDESMSSILSLEQPLNEIFMSTTEMRWKSCLEMISALVQCSRQTINNFSKNIAPEDQTKTPRHSSPRVFGLARAERAILYALKRKKTDSDVIPGTLWQLVTGHLTSICTDSPIQSLRIVALKSLMRIARGAIPSGNPPYVSHDKIIVPFLDLFSRSNADVRSGTLSAVYTVLEAEGERLSGESAWVAVLKILNTAAGPREVQSSKISESAKPSFAASNLAKQEAGAAVASGGEMVSEAFRVVQLIADDFLTSLVNSALSLWVEVLGSYSRQYDDVNVALTAIGLLWRTADYFAKSTHLSDEDGMWVRLFEMLKVTSMDDRPEVRNCAVKTLTGALSAHSFRLSARAWNGCAEHALLPLLEEVMQGGVLSRHSDEVNSAFKPRGDVPVLLHHSRDTPRKQWNETRVLALAGVAKVLRTAMPRLAILQDESGRPLFHMLTDGGSDGLWRKMLRAAGVAAGSRDSEVAVAGVSALLELLSAAGFVLGNKDGNSDTDCTSTLEQSASAPAVMNTRREVKESQVSWISGVMGSTGTGTGSMLSNASVLPTKKLQVDSTVPLWEAVWSALQEAIGGDTEKKSVDHRPQEHNAGVSRIVDSQALRMLAEGLLRARTKLSRKFTSDSSKMLVDVLIYLALGEHWNLKEKTDSSGLTDVQKAVLSGLETLSFDEDEESWTRLLQGLLLAVEEPVDGERSRALVKRILSLTRELYSKEEMPQRVKRTELPGTLRAVGVIMLLRNKDEVHSHNSSVTRGNNSGGSAVSSEPVLPLWAEATDVVIEAMSKGTTLENDESQEVIWKEFIRTMEAFLYSPQRTQCEVEYRRNVVEDDHAEEYDMRISECVQQALRRMDASTSQETKQRLVGLLARGAEEGKASGRPRFVRSCQKRLFRLADAMRTKDPGATRGELRMIAEESNKCVVETCGKVLGQFIADGQRAGRCPLPAARRAEAVFLLQQLRRLNWCEGEEEGGFSQTHLMTLYPRLCECVDSRDEAVRHLARELLDEVTPSGKERGHTKGGMVIRV